MSFLTNARISIKVFVGFGVILLLLLSIASFGVYSLIQADTIFAVPPSPAKPTRKAEYRPTC